MKKKVANAEQLLETIENGINELVNSSDFKERYKEVLKFQSKFTNYSYNNLLLIFLQNPNASLVAGYKTWQTKHQRNVVKGEKGISILAPSPYKYKKEVEIEDPITKQTKKETKEFQALKFRKISVFDISQTEGKPVPSLIDELKGNSKYADKVISSLITTSDIPITYEKITGGAKGYYSPSENRIVINEGMGKDQTVKTLIHEIAHSKMHSPELMKTTDKTINTRTKEVQAESVAYIVSDRFGIDTSSYTFGYLASWSKNLELKELKSSFNEINKTANEIIKKVELKLLPEIVKEKIVELYKEELPSIKFIKEETAIKISNFNREKEKESSIKEIKNEYLKLGNKLSNGDNTVEKEFNDIKDIVNDIKSSQLKLANENTQNMGNASILAKDISLTI